MYERLLRNTVRLFALVDLPVVAWLAVPGLAPWFLVAIDRIDAALGWGGFNAALPPIGWLFVNLAGVLGLLWAWIRLTRPGPQLAWLDGLGRLIVAALLVYYIEAANVTPVLLVFVTTEVAGAAAQLGTLGIMKNVARRGDARDAADIQP